ncbi:unnamed protein product [Didymodactylos carnosus]|uniref:F-box domain-containing protein n=1 Tax=Didymodactylos carnosus TaxID=1234261 RepID=A0A814SXM0_9BILA|nr:unnamed protein product [Didymodactylos carnosus]CAF1280575.1 unnamed protein product [Didymodactylos carnosus]CAF3916965.1 unnamed protein product [Didymodactylos carnosus]CAF4085372.1 unnamed protein product [Didymodactylos carnosus]
MSDIRLPTCIEQLPNEVFLEIFGYSHRDHVDLCRAWANLTFRLNSILRSARSCLHVFSDGDLRWDSKYLQEWAEIVVSFKDHRRTWGAWDETYTKLQYIDIRPFINLRRFSQMHEESGLLSQISPANFPRLECLHFSYYKADSYSRILFDDPFPFLTSVSGVYLVRTLCEGTTTNNIIRRIVVTFDYEANLFPLLISFIKRLPNLTTLRVDARKLEETALPCKITTKIRTLSINANYDINLDEIEFLLQIGPVKRFYLQIGTADYRNSGEKPFDFVRLAQILRSCQTLQHVELRVWLNHEGPDIEQIRALSPWLATIDLEYMRYHDRYSLQTFQHRFDDKHIHF